MIFPEKLFENSYEGLFQKISVRSKALYTLILSALLLALASLPFIVVDVSVQANGIIRPIAEKAEIHFPISGKIKNVLVEENQHVNANALIFSLSTEMIDAEIVENLRLQNEYQMWINDLKKLAARDTTSIFEEVSVSPTYSEQYQHLLFQLRSNRDAYKKAARELAIDANLYADKVITQREFEDKKIAVSELQMTFSRLIKRQQAAWLEESQNWQIKLNALKLKAQQFEKDKKMSDIYSPITGSVQGMTGKYIGQFVQAGEFFATISPDSILIVECLVYPKDIAFVRKNQKAFIQIDAFNYNQWGFLEGKVMDIAEDFTLIDGLPTFKVRCALDRDFLALRNGFKGKLKKGMTVRTRFIVTERSLFQLLYDKIDNWLNPLQ